MTLPILPIPAYSGLLGSSTASFYKLDPTGTVPLEPLPDLVPSFLPTRITFDMIDSEAHSLDFDITEHAVQSLVDITSNIRERLNSATITGTLSGLPPLVPGGLIPPPPNPGGFFRIDLLRLNNLKALAKARQPIMVVTPWFSFPKCAIANVTPNWSPPNGESVQVSVTLKEVRLVLPFVGLMVPDFPSQTPGNNASSGGGQSAAKSTGFDGSAPPNDASGPTQLAPPTGGVP